MSLPKCYGHLHVSVYPLTCVVPSGYCLSKFFENTRDKDCHNPTITPRAVAKKFLIRQPDGFRWIHFTQSMFNHHTISFIMRLKNPRVVNEPHFLLFSASGDGMHLELWTEPRGEHVMSFREDEVHGKQAVLRLAAQDIAISLVDLKRAIELAEIDVHCESFYDVQSSN